MLLWGGSDTQSTGLCPNLSVYPKPIGLATCRLAIAPKKGKKTNLKPADEDNPEIIRRLGLLVKLFGGNYLFNPVLCVPLDGQIPGGWVFALDVTSGVISVAEITGFAM